jgi:hypothetical protein
VIAAKILAYYWIDGRSNPADILSKNWGCNQIWHLFQPVLFYSRKANELLVSEQNA